LSIKCGSRTASPASIELADNEALLEKEGTRRCPELHSPVTRACGYDRVTAVSPVAGVLIGANVACRVLHQTSLVVPLVLDRRLVPRLETGIEEERTRGRRRRDG